MKKKWKDKTNYYFFVLYESEFLAFDSHQALLLLTLYKRLALHSFSSQKTTVKMIHILIGVDDAFTMNQLASRSNNRRSAFFQQQASTSSRR